MKRFHSVLSVQFGPVQHKKRKVVAKSFVIIQETLPKALRTQVLTALTSNFGLVGLVQYAW